MRVPLRVWLGHLAAGSFVNAKASLALGQRPPKPTHLIQMASPEHLPSAVIGRGGWWATGLWVVEASLFFFILT